ncbi:RNA polymerase sigma factor [Streptomyces sp. NPDC059708]|uniref:RNA polymerase sigma factor n=1 Tax=Streptomyces sp. NPDC059708 TaxID=3346916 RepID=UPI003697AA20
MAEPGRDARSFTDMVVEVHKDKGKALVRLARSRLHAEGLPASRADAEDIVQDALVITLANAGKRPIADVYAYLCVVVSNRVRDESRRQGVADPVDVTDRSAEGRKLLWAPQAEEDVEGRLDMEEALSRMSPQQRRLTLLAKGVGYTHAEIAQITGLHRGTVAEHIRRASAYLATLAFSLGLVWIWCAWQDSMVRECCGETSPSEPDGLSWILWLLAAVTVLIPVLPTAALPWRLRRARRLRRDSDVLTAMIEVTGELTEQRGDSPPTPADYAARLRIPSKWITARTLARGRVGGTASTHGHHVPLSCRFGRSRITGIIPGGGRNVITRERVSTRGRSAETTSE